jgi:threonylcarbamoyladenosine tRNA methylthiotransferase MtaB
MLSVLIHTLGCKLNQLESEAVTDAFVRAGFVMYNPLTGTSPSIIVVNTCTVTSKADQKARRVIRKSLRDYPCSLVFVTGCYAQLDKSEIEKLENEEGRLFVLKGNDKEKLLNLPAFFFEGEDIFRIAREQFANNKETELIDRDTARESAAFQFAPEQFSSHTRSFLKIQDGCDKHCTYCRIRLARGKSISLSAQQALSRLRVLEENHAEAVLTGVNICQYRDPSDILTPNNLTGLLEYLLAGTKKISLRLSSLEPESIDESFAQVLSGKRIRPHFHLSVQSGSAKILKKMGRNYNSENIEKVTALLRSAKNDPFLACDIIAGFPGETQSEFNETLELCRKIEFAWIHVFPYSNRAGTAAFSFTDTVQEKEISGRVQILTDLAWQGRAGYVKRWLGREVEALVEKSSAEKSCCRGISDNYLKLLVKHNREKPPLPGTVLHCYLSAGQKHACKKKKDYDAVAHEIRTVF